MMLLREILLQKGRRVWQCSPRETLAQAVARLVENNIGSLVVMDCEEMVGILTERDILRACHADCHSLQGRQVGDYMTRDPIVGRLEEDIAEVMGVMTKHRIRHLPVLENEELVGIVSIGDIVKAQHAELCQENHYLKTYINGEAL